MKTHQRFELRSDYYLDAYSTQSERAMEICEIVPTFDPKQYRRKILTATDRCHCHDERFSIDTLAHKAG